MIKSSIVNPGKMKIDYEAIKQNISVYEEAKSTLPIITQFENGEVSESILYNLGLSEFGSFFKFKKIMEARGFKLVDDKISWKYLKGAISENTKTERFKTLISNKSQNSFIKLLNDNKTLDRYINGRWISKPVRSNRRGMSRGRRSNDKIEGLSYSIVPILNFIIKNNIEFDSNLQNIESMRWYTSVKLVLKNVPKLEIDITNKLMSNLEDIIEKSKIDFGKINLEYITGIINNKLTKLMLVEPGTKILCIQDYQYSIRKELTKDKYYTVSDSVVEYGKLRIYIEKDDFDRPLWVDYSYFRNPAKDRDNILENLFN